MQGQPALQETGRIPTLNPSACQSLF